MNKLQEQINAKQQQRTKCGETCAASRVQRLTGFNYSSIRNVTQSRTTNLVVVLHCSTNHTRHGAPASFLSLLAATVGRPAASLPSPREAPSCLLPVSAARYKGSRRLFVCGRRHVVLRSPLITTSTSKRAEFLGRRRRRSCVRHY